MLFFKSEYIRKALLALTILFSLLFFLATVLAIFAYLGDEQVNNYRKVPAKIIESKIEKVWKYPEMGTNGAKAQEEKWFLNISFRYKVDGKDYVSNEIGRNTRKYASINSEGPPLYMKSLTKEFYKNKDVTIWLNPEKKEISYLLNERTFLHFFYISLALGPISFLCFILKKKYN